MTKQLTINKEYEGKTFQFSHHRAIITLNDRTTQAELELLMQLHPPAVIIAETKTKEKES